MLNNLCAATDGATVMWGIVVFLGIIVGLIAIIQIAGKKLKPQGNVKLTINGEKTFEVKQGETLLGTLMGQKILLPSACGGGGTCAMCRCHITSGGGDVLPTEKGHLTLQEQRDNVRLACQVKVKEDMEIEVEPEIFSIKSWECTVRSNDNVATFIKEFIVDLPEGEILDFRAGGYIQIDIPAYKDLKYTDFDIEDQYRGDWDHFKIFDNVANNPEPIFRAYSMANHPAEGNMVSLNVRIASPPPGTNFPPGLASSYIFNLKKGDKVNISGPFGEFFMKDTDREVMFIGGGAGMAPMRSHIFDLYKTKKSGRKGTFWYGARSRKEMFFDSDFKEIMDEFPNFKYHVALSNATEEDKWAVKKDIDAEGEGFTGFIHQVILEEYLSKHEAPEDIEYYLCGPPMMISAVQDMLYNLGVEKEMIDFDDFGP
jgi:Na+-transporting NADH:ubiquinone oxidoreductase subunit F